MGSDLTVVNAARISYARESEEFRDKDARLLKYLWEHKHTSPFRHATLQFHIKAPLFVIRQWQKHQVGCAWNEISGRYVAFEPEFYSPFVWRQQHEVNKQGSKGEVDDPEEVAQIYEDNMTYALDTYYSLLNEGVCREQARLVLPLSMYTECYWTASLQAVLHFLALREDAHAQLEIQAYAQAIRALSVTSFPQSLSLQTRP